MASERGDAIRHTTAMTSRWRRHAGAPLLGLALVGHALWGLLLLPVTALALLSGARRPVLLARRVPARARLLAERWAGVAIADPYERSGVTMPRRRADGRYRHGMRVYESVRTPMRLVRIRQVIDDPATRRDLLWQVLDPIVGGLIAALPAVLIGAGTWAVLAAGRPQRGGLPGPGGLTPPDTRSAWVLASVGLGSMALGVLCGPCLLILHGRWTAVLLGPPTAVPSDGRNRWLDLRRRGRALGAGTILSVLAFYGLLLAALQLLTGVLSLSSGMMVPAYVKLVEHTRSLTNNFRSLAQDWGGITIRAPYLPRPDDPVPGPDGLYTYRRRLYATANTPKWRGLRRWALTDPATWRDLLWLLVNPVLAPLLLLTPLATVVFAAIGITLPAVQRAAFDIDDAQNGFAAAVQQSPAGAAITVSPALAVPIGLVLVAVTWWAVPYALRAHALLSRSLLAPAATTVMAGRLRQVAETRAEAAGTQAAELRRIERDLHDGAQARFVAIGMTLRAVERRLGGESDDIRELIADARANSAAALAELRDLVQGIHPPVLAERGLGDAVRALGLDTPLNVMVTVDLPGRADPPVEACAYFAVSEALTNVAKHADASRVEVQLRHRRGALEIQVRDDGRGGADPASGTGLRGIERRLSTFDGTLRVFSPPSGPTILTMELPCALSSPKTSTS